MRVAVCVSAQIIEDLKIRKGFQYLFFIKFGSIHVIKRMLLTQFRWIHSIRSRSIHHDTLYLRISTFHRDLTAFHQQIRKTKGTGHVTHGTGTFGCKIIDPDLIIFIDSMHVAYLFNFFCKSAKNLTKILIFIFCVNPLSSDKIIHQNTRIRIHSFLISDRLESAIELWLLF